MGISQYSSAYHENLIKSSLFPPQELFFSIKKKGNLNFGVDEQ